MSNSKDKVASYEVQANWNVKFNKKVDEAKIRESLITVSKDFFDEFIQKSRGSVINISFGFIKKHDDPLEINFFGLASSGGSGSTPVGPHVGPHIPPPPFKNRINQAYEITDDSVNTVVQEGYAI